MNLQAGLSALLKDDSLNPEQREEGIRKLLNYHPESIERKLSSDNPEIYAGLEERALSTPFKDYHSVFMDMNEGDRLVDLGAGYCKGELLAKSMGLGRTCSSLEISGERINYAKSVADGLGVQMDTNATFDLLSSDVPLAQAYFVYLPLGGLIYRPIRRLLEANHACHFYVSESHGDMLDFFEALPEWFELERVLDSEAIRHRPGIHKFVFRPRQVEVENINSSDFLYCLVLGWEANPFVRIEKESGFVDVPMRSLMPIKYNGKTVLECSEIKRIVDFEQVRIDSIL